MEKYYKPIFLTIILIVIIFFIFYKVDQTKNKKFKLSISKNSLKIDNFEMSKNVNDSGSYYLIKSEIAYFSKSMDKIDLDYCNIEYFADNNTLVFSADKCTYIIDKELILEHNIQGTYNEIYFKSGKDGILNYNMETGLGTIKNGITAQNENNSIVAETLLINRNQDRLEFRDNVEVKYAVE